MEFSRIDGSLDLDSDDLRGEQLTGPVHLTTRSKNIRLDGVSGDVRLQNDNGAIEVAMHTVGNVQIDNRNGDIQLSLPDKAGFRVDARTREGEIQSDFPVDTAGRLSSPDNVPSPGYSDFPGNFEYLSDESQASPVHYRVKLLPSR